MLNQLKIQLWITWTEQDTLLEQIISQAISTINHYLEVDSFEFDEHTELVEHNWIDKYLLKNRPVSELLEVNDEVVTSSDYMIVNKRKIILDVAPDSNKWYVKFKYRAWYVVYPWFLQSIYIKLASGIYNYRNSIGIKQYRLWDETITYATQEEYMDFHKSLYKLKKWYVVS